MLTMARMLLDWGSGAIGPGVTVGTVGIVSVVITRALLAALSTILDFCERRRTGDQQHAEVMALIAKADGGALADLTGPLTAVAARAVDVTSSDARRAGSAATDADR